MKAKERSEKGTERAKTKKEQMEEKGMLPWRRDENNSRQPQREPLRCTANEPKEEKKSRKKSRRTTHNQKQKQKQGEKREEEDKDTNMEARRDPFETATTSASLMYGQCTHTRLFKYERSNEKSTGGAEEEEEAGNDDGEEEEEGRAAEEAKEAGNGGGMRSTKDGLRDGLPNTLT